MGLTFATDLGEVDGSLLRVVLLQESAIRHLSTLVQRLVRLQLLDESRHCQFLIRCVMVCMFCFKKFGGFSSETVHGYLDEPIYLNHHGVGKASYLKSSHSHPPSHRQSETGRRGYDLTGKASHTRRLLGKSPCVNARARCGSSVIIVRIITSGT